MEELAVLGTEPKIELGRDERTRSRFGQGREVDSERRGRDSCSNMRELGSLGSVDAEGLGTTVDLLRARRSPSRMAAGKWLRRRGGEALGLVDALVAAGWIGSASLANGDQGWKCGRDVREATSTRIWEK